MKVILGVTVLILRGYCPDGNYPWRNTLLKSDVTRHDHVVRCRGSQECWFTLCQFHCQFNSRWHSLRITLTFTTLVCMRSSNAWTTKPWQRSEWHLGFNSVLSGGIIWIGLLSYLDGLVVEHALDVFEESLTVGALVSVNLSQLDLRHHLATRNSMELNIRFKEYEKTMYLTVLILMRIIALNLDYSVTFWSPLQNTLYWINLSQICWKFKLKQWQIKTEIHVWIMESKITDTLDLLILRGAQKFFVWILIPCPKNIHAAAVLNVQQEHNK